MIHLPLHIIAGILIGFVFVGLVLYLFYRWEKEGVWDTAVTPRKNRILLGIISGICILVGVLMIFLISGSGMQMSGVMLFFSSIASIGFYFLMVALFYKKSSKEPVP